MLDRRRRLDAVWLLARLPVRLPNAAHADAHRALERVCEWIERNEPSNPAPLLIRRAQRLMSKSFIDIIRDLAPETLPSDFPSGELVEPQAVTIAAADGMKIPCSRRHRAALRDSFGEAPMTAA